MPKWATVAVRRGRLLFPDICPGCLQPNPSSADAVQSDYGRFSGYYVLFYTTKHLVTQVPHCTECARKLRRIRMWSSLAVLAGLLCAAIVGIELELGRLGWFAAAVVLCAPGVIASEYLGKSVSIGWYDKNHVEFQFRSAEYAAEFERLNAERAGK